MSAADYNIIIWLGLGFLFLMGNLLFQSRKVLITNPNAFIQSYSSSTVYSISIQVLFYFLLAVHLRRFLKPDTRILFGFWQQVFLIFALGILIFALHWLLRGLVSWLLREGEFWIKNYRQNVFLKSYAIFGLWILLLVFESGFTLQNNLILQSYILLAFLGLYVLINFWKDHFDRDFMASYSLYHKFLYLCALEILPLAVILKGILDVG